MFFKRRRAADDVKPGSIYHRIYAPNVVEIAQVTWVGKGPAGQPHVRFQTSYKRPDNEEPQGDRLLALDTFAERYQPLLAAHA
ncbi:MAG: hypothetical protein KIT81_17635 [Alphaproteobacteria bacterium]|nr:hypothetical protein [Alphaproteobacteria bacterium]MCW5752960.1 hypothetical protein [Alphaproteobacteria bacterium]